MGVPVTESQLLGVLTKQLAPSWLLKFQWERLAALENRARRARRVRFLQGLSWPGLNLLRFSALAFSYRCQSLSTSDIHKWLIFLSHFLRLQWLNLWVTVNVVFLPHLGRRKQWYSNSSLFPSHADWNLRYIENFVSSWKWHFSDSLFSVGGSLWPSLFFFPF